MMSLFNTVLSYYGQSTSVVRIRMGYNGHRQYNSIYDVLGGCSSQNFYVKKVTLLTRMKMHTKHYNLYICRKGGFGLALGLIAVHIALVLSPIHIQFLS